VFTSKVLFSVSCLAFTFNKSVSFTVLGAVLKRVFSAKSGDGDAVDTALS
jgi:hypothetical protein